MASYEYDCPFDGCSRGYTRYNDLKKHWTNIHKQSIEELTQLQPPQDQKPFVCTECSRTFTRKDTLKGHVAKFHGKKETKEGRFKCPYDECELTPPHYTVQSLIKHCQTVHTEEFGKWNFIEQRYNIIKTKFLIRYPNSEVSIWARLCCLEGERRGSNFHTLH